MVVMRPGGLVLGVGGPTGYLVAPGGLLALVLVAAAAHLLVGAGRHPWHVLPLARSFAVVNLAFDTGWLNVLRSREIEVWHRTQFRAEG